MSPGAAIALTEMLTFPFHIYWPSFSPACCVFNQYALGTSVHYRGPELTKMHSVVCEEGQIGFLFFLSASFVLIKTLWDSWEELNVLKDRSMLRVTYIPECLP